jgi:hypothetical protein
MASVNETIVREQSTALLRDRGVDAVIPFRVILTDLIGQVEVNRNYQKSDLPVIFYPRSFTDGFRRGLR